MKRFGPNIIRRGGTSPAAESRVLKAKGLPWRCSATELCNFFQDYALLRVVLLPTADGRPSGMAFAEFETPEEAVRAMTSRNGDFIGDRYVKLLRVPHEEMEEQTAGLLLTAAASHSDSSAAAVAVAALNFQALGLNSRRRYSPEQEAQQQQQMQQLQQLHQLQLQGLQEQHQQQQQQLQQQEEEQPPEQQQLQPSQLGSAKSASIADVTDAGSGSWDVPAGNSGIITHMTSGGLESGWNPMGISPRPFTGAADYPSSFNSSMSFPFGLGPSVWAPNCGHVELPEDTGDKPIAILIAEQQETIRAALRGGAVSAESALPPYQQVQSTSQLLHPQPQQQTPFQAIGSQIPRQQPYHQNMMLPVSFHQQTPPLQFQRNDHRISNALHRGNMQDLPLPGPSQMPHMMLGTTFPGGGFPGVYKGHHGDAQLPQRQVRADGSTVKMRGLPFRATTVEILRFFQGFKIVPGSLHLGSDLRGRPSGEGWLTFETAEEAKAVAKARNKQFMGKRYLELSLC